MDKNICQICGIEKSDDVIFYTHHIKHKKHGGDSNGKTIKICNDCHSDIHYPEHSEDGNIKDLENIYKQAIEQNIFSEGQGIIPNKILHDSNISSFAKLLYCDISSLCASRGYCWATNSHFAKVFNSHIRTIARAMVELEPFIIVRNKASSKRIIWVHQLGNTIKPFEKKINKKLKKDLIKKTKKPIIKYTDEDQFLAELLLSKIIYNFEHFENKQVKILDWADDIRKLREINGATAEQIKFMITWVHGGDLEINGKQKHFEPHDFWSSNIMSANKLRKQWVDNLVPQLKKDLKKNTQTQL